MSCTTPEISQEYLYVVVTQTGTILSRILKVITHASYNHSSVSLDPTLRILYSFGRKNAYNPFWGGFVQESPFFGTFKRFSETEAVVLRFPVTADQREAISRRLEYMHAHPNQYHYNTLGLLLAAFRIHLYREDYFYCSEFVKSVLLDSGVIREGDIGDIAKPIQFLDLPYGSVIYRGKLRLFSKQHVTSA